MAHDPKVVAELGRPETPDEAAARKAESSRVYRASQNTRNLIAALLATLAVVAVIIFAVPRGELPPPRPIDVAAIAQNIESSEGRSVIVPDVPEGWLVNRASIEGDSTAAWTIVYVPDEASGFLRVAQGFDADPAWPTRVLSGASVDSTVSIEGIEWDRYRIPDPARAGNISAALSTQAGEDTILIYGSTDDEHLELAAASVADQIRALRADTAGKDAS
ncbi:DUF4245 family protein [Microbacterium sp. zg.B48]|uniref:DUF4245 family protein n=1 Tax=unclassified Microbacterium TaxID=2609290 RepID=UPI00214C4D3D|nr:MULTISPECIES: DUF4245 family protein [unclassified Microbacterium]MCR2762279.1 DUF4245 family protein [Microbacterium sp. zg.B48]MCR2809715.1 DUF4245 family protein [Microbacterium sp. zg.B185]WIM17969.1 DUF4245 family protein [Microbacterium sp. zg-B185]